MKPIRDQNYLHRKDTFVNSLVELRYRLHSLSLTSFHPFPKFNFIQSLQFEYFQFHFNFIQSPIGIALPLPSTFELNFNLIINSIDNITRIELNSNRLNLITIKIPI